MELYLKDDEFFEVQHEDRVADDRFIPVSVEPMENTGYASPYNSQYHVSLNEGELLHSNFETLNTSELAAPPCSGRSGFQGMTECVPGSSSAPMSEPVQEVNIEDLAIGSNEFDRHAYGEADTEDEDWYDSDDDREAHSSDSGSGSDEEGGDDTEETILMEGEQIAASSMLWGPFCGIQSSDPYHGILHRTGFSREFQDISETSMAIGNNDEDVLYGCPRYTDDRIERHTLFENLEQAKLWIGQYAVHHRLPYRVERATPDRWHVKCYHDGLNGHVCGWKVVVSSKKSSGRWTIGKVVQPHNEDCASMILDLKHPNLNSKLIAHMIGSLVREQPSIMPRAIRAHILSTTKYMISYGQAWRAKKLVTEMLWGTWIDGYRMLVPMLQAIKRANPSTYYTVDAEEILDEEERGLANERGEGQRSGRMFKSSTETPP